MPTGFGATLGLTPATVTPDEEKAAKEALDKIGGDFNWVAEEQDTEITVYRFGLWRRFIHATRSISLQVLASYVTSAEQGLAAPAPIQGQPQNGTPVQNGLAAGPDLAQRMANAIGKQLPDINNPTAVNAYLQELNNIANAAVAHSRNAQAAAQATADVLNSVEYNDMKGERDEANDKLAKVTQAVKDMDAASAEWKSGPWHSIKDADLGKFQAALDKAKEKLGITG